MRVQPCQSVSVCIDAGCLVRESDYERATQIAQEGVSPRVHLPVPFAGGGLCFRMATSLNLHRLFYRYDWLAKSMKRKTGCTAKTCQRHLTTESVNENNAIILRRQNERSTITWIRS